MIARRKLASLVIVAALALAPLSASSADGPPAGRGDYQSLVALYEEFLDWKREAPIVGEISDSAAFQGVADYGPKAVAARRAEIKSFLTRLEDMNVASWDRAQQAEFLAVRAKVNEENFRYNFSRPWERDPGFYVDQMLHVTFTEIPAEGEALARLRAQLAAIPVIVAEGRKNLKNVAADYADLAIHNLSNADGVGHGHPYRTTPPPGVIGWYADLLARVDAAQPELRPEVEAAKASVESFDAWLKQNRPRMTAQGGVGKDAFDWYLKNVKLMPYTSDEIVTLGLRELDRLWALYALERHRNRDLPEIERASTGEDYAARIAKTDADTRKFLVEEEIITIPDYVNELDTNVPWIVRPQGPNFWEEVQYRDPTPDHWHAVIPGHRFDGVVEDNNPHPIRGRLTDGVRTEGWGVYLEEGLMHAGGIETKPRVRELIYIFGIFRAARVPADVWLQRNEMTVPEVVSYWRERTPYLDENVARVDAEIYLRRPPGYGLGYTMGMLQMQELLGDYRRLKGDSFVLKDFHDEFMAKGRLPMSLIRWEMTGLDDEVKRLWKADPLPRAPR